MDSLTTRFAGPSRLLVLALMSGTSGALRALRVFEKQQRCNLNISLQAFLDTLCQKDLSLETHGDTVPKPLVCLFPVAFKRNLLHFLRLVNPVQPQPSVVQLLQCLSPDTRPDPWVTALLGQLQRDGGSLQDQSLCTATCSQRIRSFSQHFNPPGSTEGWLMSFTDQTLPQIGEDISVVGQQKKRKNIFLTPDTHVESTRQHKRIKMDLFDAEEGLGGDPGDTSPSGEHVLRDERQSYVATVVSEQPTSNVCDLPEDLKASVPQMKKLLECPTEWDQSSTDVFQVLNECDSAQVELLCGMLSLADTPEETLPKLCSCLLALSPELSYSAAATIIKSLLLEKVLSLLEPASRCLVTAVTSLCCQYPRAACHALITPILQEGNIGTQQAELLHRIIEDCLEPHYNLLVFQTTFQIEWSDSVLSIIHSLLDSKLDMNEKLFTDFIEQLVSQAPQFFKSMKFAKMMLTVLTKYSCHVTTAHKASLSHCLMLNETFLKKSLQAALKRTTH